MSKRACKEIINENMVEEARQLKKQAASFESLFGRPGFPDDAYDEAITVDRKVIQALKVANRAYGALRDRVAEAVD